ncbi:MAG: ParB/RepB/Spo0J family partition protein [Oligoflexia bacterium]|nr:ParB/RepB/Spo0J family partition protein [Oligoflexia bacterium]
MAKSFAPRTSKKDRSIINLPTSSLKPSIQELFRSSDQKLLQGAKLSDVKLSKITIRNQVRTKFNDSSLKELADNIKSNGLIQPLVIHRENDKFILLCGERRYRAMQLLGTEEAACFILEGKTKEELMAIQFSENSSREELHFIDKADGIYNYHVATKASERKIEQDLGICKTEVHRAIQIAKLPREIKEAAKIFNIEKYVLLEFGELASDNPQKERIFDGIVRGEITKRTHFKKALTEIPGVIITAALNSNSSSSSKGLSKQSRKNS